MSSDGNAVQPRVRSSALKANWRSAILNKGVTASVVTPKLRPLEKISSNVQRKVAKNAEEAQSQLPAWRCLCVLCDTALNCFI